MRVACSSARVKGALSSSPVARVAVDDRRPAVLFKTGPKAPLRARTPRGDRALPLAAIEKPLSSWTQAEQQLYRPTSALKMPGAVLGQPPARGTLGLVVYLRDRAFPHLVSPPLTVAFILPAPLSTPTSWSPHASQTTTLPEVSSPRPSAPLVPAVSFGLRFPEVLWRSDSLSHF